jgi:TRAP transporter 4TM/12TM fusion protein
MESMEDAHIMKELSLEPKRVAVGICGISIMGLAIVYQFNICMLLEEFYLYILLALATPILFLTRNYKGEKSKKVPWYDWLIAIISLGICGSFALQAKTIYMMGWEAEAPKVATWSAVILYIIILEGTRRTYGWILFSICAVFIIEPVFANNMPGPLQGIAFSFERVMSYHAFGHESLLGPISKVCGRLLVGYLFFAGMLQVTGGGQFFIDLALTFFGKARGASAKIAVVGSGAFGMLTGAPIPNILTTGAFTVPAMKKTGYPPYYAAAVEACASTGGSIVPPVMGAGVFIMASLVERPYWELCLAALLPAIIYYLVLFVQADSYAGRVDLPRMTVDEIPTFIKVLSEGFPYFLCVGVLLWFVVFLQQVGVAPFWGILSLLLASALNRSTHFSIKDLWLMLENSFSLIGDIFVLIYTLGALVGSLNMTGTAPVLASNMVSLVGPHTWLIPIVTAVAAYILGIGLTTTAIYIILAVTVAPAMVSCGIHLVNSHLFCFYVGLLSYIIPPVALSAVTAGQIAGDSRVFKVGFTSMRLGMGLFFIPFYLVFCPSLVLGQNYPIWQSGITFILVATGLSVLGMAFERYMIRFHLSIVAAVVLGSLGIIISLIPMLLF